MVIVRRGESGPGVLAFRPGDLRTPRDTDFDISRLWVTMLEPLPAGLHDPPPASVFNFYVKPVRVPEPERCTRAAFM